MRTARPVADKPRPHPWMPTDWDEQDAYALQALQSGTATAEQQVQALSWIVNKACDTYGLSYRSDGQGGERDTAFAEGRRYVGLQIVKLVKVAPAVTARMKAKKNE